MLRLTSLGARLATIGLSAAAHAALLAPLGHAAASRGTTDDTVNVELLEPPAPARDTPEPEPTAAPTAGHAAHWPTHTHSYPVPPGHDETPHDPNLVHLPGLPHAAPAAASPAETTTDDTPRFNIVVGPSAGDAHGAVSPAGTAPAHEDETTAILAESSVDGKARLARGVSPAYPDIARADGIEGDVGLELVVGVSGAVESARVVRSVGHGLDQAALLAAHQFRFTPATRAGRPVRVRMGWSVQFRLR